MVPLRLGSLEWGSIAVNLFGRVRDLETCIEVAGGTNIGCNCSKKEPSCCWVLMASILCDAQHSSSGGRWHRIWKGEKMSFFGICLWYKISVLSPYYYFEAFSYKVFNPRSGPLKFKESKISFVCLIGYHWAIPFWILWTLINIIQKVLKIKFIGKIVIFLEFVYDIKFLFCLFIIIFEAFSYYKVTVGLSWPLFCAMHNATLLIWRSLAQDLI